MTDDPTDPKPPAKPDPSAVVIPFGKHKGKAVGELLAADPQYADWLLAQGWLAERFADLHAAIMSRGAGTDDTPEHNALQARFLNDEFRAAFVLAVAPSAVDSEAIAAYSRNMAGQLDLASPVSGVITEYFEVVELCRSDYDIPLHRYSPLRFDPQFIEFANETPSLDEMMAKRLKARLDGYTKVPWVICFLPFIEGMKHHNKLAWKEDKAACLQERRARAEKVIASEARLVTKVEGFEVRGVDVVLGHGLYHKVEDLTRVGGYNGRLDIELKPTLGDDFPTVIRQMRRLASRHLLIGSYTGRAVPLPDLRRMFEVNGMTLVTVQEVEAEIANARVLIAPNLGGIPST